MTWSGLCKLTIQDHNEHTVTGHSHHTKQTYIFRTNTHIRPHLRLPVYRKISHARKIHECTCKARRKKCCRRRKRMGIPILKVGKIRKECSFWRVFLFPLFSNNDQIFGMRRKENPYCLSPSCIAMKEISIISWPKPGSFKCFQEENKWSLYCTSAAGEQRLVLLTGRELDALALGTSRGQPCQTGDCDAWVEVSWKTGRE